MFKIYLKILSIGTFFSHILCNIKINCCVVAPVPPHLQQDSVSSSLEKTEQKQQGNRVSVVSNLLYKKRNSFTVQYRGFAWQEQYKCFCIRMNILAHRNNIELFLPCNMAAMQNLYMGHTDACTCIQLLL